MAMVEAIVTKIRIRVSKSPYCCVSPKAKLVNISSSSGSVCARLFPRLINLVVPLRETLVAAIPWGKLPQRMPDHLQVPTKYFGWFQDYIRWPDAKTNCQGRLHANALHPELSPLHLRAVTDGHFPFFLIIPSSSDSYQDLSARMAVPIVTASGFESHIADRTIQFIILCQARQIGLPYKNFAYCTFASPMGNTLGFCRTSSFSYSVHLKNLWYSTATLSLPMPI